MLKPGASAVCRGLAGLLARLAGGLLLAELGPAAQLARLLVVLVRPQLLLHAAAFDEFLEPAQGETDRLFLVDTHSQAHSSSSQETRPPRGSRPGSGQGKTDKAPARAPISANR